MRVGIVCPYTWDVPGGVQAHVRDLADSLLELGHEVSVLTPVDDPEEAELPPYVVPAGRAVPVPYNGSVARLAFGPLSFTRTRRWLRDGHFDVLHIHEPTVPSLSMLACFTASGPIVATFHTATARSRALQVFGTVLLPGLEKITGRFAVSPAARRVVVEHLGGDAVLIPNGVDVRRFQGAQPLPRAGGGPTISFLGRIDEPRKGLAVLLEALPELVELVPDVRLLVAGPGDVDEVAETIPPSLRGHVELLGLVSDADKPRVYASGDVYCAPNTHGESFGIVLIESMATGTPVVASDLEAFRRVLEVGRAGVLVPVADPAALAAALADLLADPDRRKQLAEVGRETVQQYDWQTVTARIVEVYETVVAAVPRDTEFAVDVDHAVDAFADDLAGDDDDPSRLSAALRRWLSRTPS
ncbi:MAG: phosphatidyl-myo-inositol alpha-mannosyltransferase [Actinomycetota bacterium]|nr:phosphatidyl-myo-inositol alpha-mannosyltransferase [Actinomycetota bacterium]